MHGSGLLRRALEAARRRQRAQAGLPPPRPGAGEISRRALIKALGASAALASGPAWGAGRPARTVAIVGGGLAGLVALRSLSRAGISARLYEGRHRLGGRIYTMRGPDKEG
jgi:monoamine oxidase